MNDTEFIYEITKSTWAGIIFLMATPLIFAVKDTWQKIGSFLIAVGYGLLATSMFTSYSEVEVIGWIIRLGVTFLLAGVLYNQTLRIRNPFKKEKPKPPVNEDVEVEQVSVFLETLKYKRGK